MRRLRVTSALLTVVFAALSCAGVVLTASRASAVFQDLVETGKPGFLTLALDSATPLQADLAPGDSMRWLVEASLNDATAGTLSFELQANGELVENSGMLAEVSACTGSFDIAAVPVSCEGSFTTALPETPLTAVSQQGNQYQLAELQQDAPRQLLVTLTIPASTPASTIAGQSARIGLGVHSAGDDEAQTGTVVPVNPPPVWAGLAVTGADALALGVLAAGLAGLGAVAALHGRRRGLGRDGHRNRALEVTAPVGGTQ